ncbi:SPX domain-containing membrane protein [Capsicum annuum]|nr:SPX domain-containing membrane protein [Capsicum annuum]
MVAFGKKLKERQIQEWQGYYINYKVMKKKVKEYADQIQAGALNQRYLLFFVEINAIGLRKILKKFDKRFGYKFTDYCVKTWANHTYSQLQQVFNNVGLGAVVGAISRNLADLQDREGSYLSIYDQPALPLQDLVVDSMEAAIDRLSYSTNFLNFSVQRSLIMLEELPTPVEEHVDDQRYHFMALLVNLANTFLYMINTYIVVPTADDYSMSLGAAATVCGIVIGAMAVAQIFSSVYFSAWSNRSYFRSLIFSSIVLFVGNVMYALAYDLNSIPVLLIGRIFCRLTSMEDQMREARLRWFGHEKKRCTDIPVTEVMAFAWLIYLIWLWISFREPAQETDEVNNVPQKSNTENDAFEKGVVQSLLLKSVGDEQDIEGDQECDGSEEAPEESRRPGNSIVEAYRLFTPSVKVCGVPFCFQGEIKQGAKEGKGLQRGPETFRLSWHPIIQPKG